MLHSRSRLILQNMSLHILSDCIEVGTNFKHQAKHMWTQPSLTIVWSISLYLSWMLCFGKKHWNTTASEHETCVNPASSTDAIMRHEASMWHCFQKPSTAPLHVPLISEVSHAYTAQRPTVERKLLTVTQGLPAIVADVGPTLLDMRPQCPTTPLRSLDEHLVTKRPCLQMER